MPPSSDIRKTRPADAARIAAPSPAQQLKNREQRHNALRVTRERRARTRELILLGSWVAANAQDPAAQRVYAAMDDWLTRPQDRLLFDLPQRD